MSLVIKASGIIKEGVLSAGGYWWKVTGKKEIQTGKWFFSVMAIVMLVFFLLKLIAAMPLILAGETSVSQPSIDQNVEAGSASLS